MLNNEGASTTQSGENEKEKEKESTVEANSQDEGVEEDVENQSRGKRWGVTALASRIHGPKGFKEDIPMEVIPSEATSREEDDTTNESLDSYEQENTDPTDADSEIGSTHKKPRKRRNVEDK